jgi:hypothetical protein
MVNSNEHRYYRNGDLLAMTSGHLVIDFVSIFGFIPSIIQHFDSEAGSMPTDRTQMAILHENRQMQIVHTLM